MSPVRVLVADDSAFARKVVRSILESTPGIEVVGIARDGVEALEKIAELAPDVLTLDLVMPNLDGLGVLRALAGRNGPRVLVVSVSDANSDLGIAALQAGAVDLLHKPTAWATDRLFEMRQELVDKVLAAAAARPLPAAEALPRLPEVQARAAVRTRLVVVGTSTGGPQALTRLISTLPADFPVPLAVALHIPAGYTDALARRLDEASAITVVEAVDGMLLSPGMAVIAPGGMHLTLAPGVEGLVAHVGLEPATTLHRPSVDVLFASAAAATGADTLGVVLTGMGDDGLAGARAIVAAGGRVLTEAERTAVIYGMPRVVAEAGLSSGEAGIDQMGALLLSRLD